MHKILAVAVGPGKTQTNVIGGGQVSKLRPFLKALSDGLQRLGHEPGVSFDIDYLEDEPPRLAKAIKAALNQSKYAVIFPIASTALTAARRVTKTIPIVFPSISYPVEENAVKSYACPATNATGINAMRSHTAPDCLELFKQAVPSLRQVYALYQPGYVPAMRAMPDLRRAARRAGVKFTIQSVKERRDIANRLSSLSQAGPVGNPQVGLLVIPDDLVLSDGHNLINLAHAKGIPTFFPVVDFVNATPHSALGAYGIPHQLTGEAAAQHVHKVLGGVKPAHLPVKRAGGFEWAVNTQVAKALAITIPTHVLRAADRVI